MEIVGHAMRAKPRFLSPIALKMACVPTEGRDGLNLVGTLHVQPDPGDGHAIHTM